MSDKRALASHSANEEQTIDWYCVAADVAKEWLSILLLTIAAGILSYIFFDNF